MIILSLTGYSREHQNPLLLLSFSEVSSLYPNIKESNKDIDGVRIYLGSNSDTDLTTLFIAPTSKEKDDTTLNVLNRFIDGYPPKKKYTF